MQSNRKNTSEDSKPPKRGINLDPFFYEYDQVSSRYYLQFTNLALFLVFFLTLGAMAMILGLFLWNSSHEPQETDVNVRPAVQAPANYSGPVIQPPPPLPRVVQGPNPAPGLPNPLTTPTPARNTNRMPARSPSPSPTPGPPPVRTPSGAEH